MTPELEDRALNIVVQLAETPADKRDELRRQLCGDDTELNSAVAEMWQAHEAAERKEFWQRPAFEQSALMKGLEEAVPSEVPREHPASTEETLVTDPNAAASEATLVPPPLGSGGAQPVGAAQDSASGSANSRSSKRAGKRAAESVSPPPNAPTGSRFIPKDLLGKGGQGEVWFALDPELGRHVALKVVKPNLRGSEPIIAGFNRESEITGKLEHPNIVPVYEAGLKLDLVGQPDESGPFYTMRAYGDRRWLKALEAFHARPRPVGDRALIEATKAFHDDRSESNRRDLEEQWRKFNFDSQHAGDRDLKEAVRGLLDEVGDSLAGSLQQAIDQFHAGDWSEPKLRDLLERFVDVCNALAYAHDRGVIHRDLKPLNVMLGEFGETLVADWGLAKIVGRDDAHRADSIERTLQAEQDAGASRVGDIKGTLVYMSPEQASGHVDTLGPASDIYSLGAILFCLLTGQAPVTARPKSPEPLPRKPAAAGSVEAAEIPPAAPAPAPRLTFSEILTRVRENEFPRPTLIDPRVPKALEAIVLKAMSKKPRERYAMAKLLADDVKRWLNDEPVTAWREPFTVRAKRWGKNHQTAVTSTAAAVLMAAVTLSVMFVVVTAQKAEIAKSLQREQDAKKSERDAKELAQQNERRATAGEARAKSNEQRAIAGEADATAAKLRAETNATAASQQSQLALSTLSAVIFDIQRSLKNVPGGATVRNRLLTSVLPQLDQVSQQFASKSAIDRNTMAALIDLADTILQLGDTRSTGDPSVSDGAAVSDSPRPGTPGRGVGAEGPGVATSAVLTAERLYLRAHKIGKQLAAANPNDTNAQRDLSISFNKLGDVYLTLGRTNEALTQFQAYETISRKLVEANPNDVQKQRDLSISFEKLGNAFLTLGRIDDALTQFQDALKISRVLSEADPNDTQKQRDLSYSFTSLGDVFLKLGRTDEGLRQHQEAAKIHRVLAEADPHDVQKQRDLLISFNRLGDVFLTLGRTDDALAQFEECSKMCRALAQSDPRDVQKQRDLSISFERLGDVFLKLGRIADALTQCQEKMKISRVLAEADPGSAEKQRDLMLSHFKLGEVEVQAGQFESAKARYDSANEILDRMIDNGQNVAASKQEKDIMKGRIQFCTAATLATGTWDALLQSDAKSLPGLLTFRVTELTKRGQLAEVVQAGAKLRELSAAAEAGSAVKQKGGMLYNAACAYGLCATLVVKDKPQPTDSENAEHQKYLDLSLACLKEAIAAGWDDFDHIQQDSDLTPLRKLPEFQALLKQRPQKKP